VNKTYAILVGGAAGQGIKSTGVAVARHLAKAGFNVYTYSEYPSLIRGGHNTTQITFSKDPVNAPIKQVDLLIAFNKEAVEKHPCDSVLETNNIDEILHKITEVFRLENPDPGRDDHFVVNGNEAVAYGAIAVGLQFAAIYPMSPISGIIDVLAKHQKKFGFIYRQPEDEIAAINMAIGASYAGARAMTATSGGGFCLMTEGFGLAGMTETPLVIVLGMRPGPATGLPTWSEQGDLQFVLNAHQGDFPRIVLAAGDVTEAFNLTLEAFNLADRYKTPVVLLLDKNLCEGDQSIILPDYSSYQIDHENTLPKRANSDEHDDEGFSIEESSERIKQMNKRMKKLDDCTKNDMLTPHLIGAGPETADLTIVSWGSCKGPIIDALREFNNVNYLHLTWFSPFPSEAVKNILENSKRVLAVEQNYSGQMCRLIREKTGVEIKDKLLKYDGRMFYREEIIDKIQKLL
jgi:2-oxoglutarate ferredoxin oxidoreductase subunit alpha